MNSSSLMCPISDVTTDIPENDSSWVNDGNNLACDNRQTINS